jgi:hypothetical protein
MASLTPSYEYRDDQVLAVFENQVIAHGPDFAKVSQTAEEYLNSLGSERSKRDKEDANKKATHIETPNGLKGEIISRVDGVWGEEITVRFSNNQIRRFETGAAPELKYSVQAAETPANYREALQTVLDRAVHPNREGLNARLDELDAVRREAAQHVGSVSSLTEQQALHQMVLTAEAEMQEVKEALAHLDAVDAENVVVAPPTYSAVEQADMGRSDSWLDVVAHEMIAESEDEDLDKLEEEGPTKLVSELDDSAVHNAGTVRELAQAFIVAKTAGFQGEQLEAYRECFVANAETARRRELTYRQDNARKETVQKEASLENVPDEALFI